MQDEDGTLKSCQQCQGQSIRIAVALHLWFMARQRRGLNAGTGGEDLLHPLLSSIISRSLVSARSTGQTERIMRSFAPPMCDATGGLKLHVVLPTFEVHFVFKSDSSFV